jgi:alpha-mannosidase
VFHFWINGGKAKERLQQIDREALIKNEAPMALPYFPPCTGGKALSSVVVSDAGVQVTATKIAEENNWLLIRLFEPIGKKTNTSVSVSCLDLSFDVSLNPYEIKTIAVDLDSNEIFEVDLIEQKL